MNHQFQHQYDKPCPITGDPIPGELIFTDHARPGCYNACRACHEDDRGLAERLGDLANQRESKGSQT